MMRPNKGSRLTELHINELSHILSRLPTKEAVRTSILSKDWRYKWTSSYTVDIGYFRNTDPPLFVNFMNMILVSLKHFTSFRLVYASDDLNHLQSWINTALKHSLESLVLNLFDFGEVEVEGSIIIPCSLLNSTCLRKLQLGCYLRAYGRSTLNVAANTFAPNLTSLNIIGIDIVNNHTTSTTLKFSFPLLKKFEATDNSWSNVTSVEIHAPSLTEFSSSSAGSDYPYLFVILSPRVTSFSCSIRLCEEFVVSGSSIVYASLFVGLRPKESELSDIGLRARKMVTEFRNLQKLSLATQVLPFVYPLPLYNKLRTLHLFGDINAELLLELLHKTPSLEVLRFSVKKWVDFDFEAIDSIPSCVVSHLEEVHIENFICEPPQYNLLKFLLKNSEKLKKLIMVCVPPSDKQNQVEEYISALRISGLTLEFGLGLHILN